MRKPDGFMGWSESDEAINEAAIQRYLDSANGQLAQYGAVMHPYGEGAGLWPHIAFANGRTVTP